MVEIRPITRDELRQFRLAINFGFGYDLPDSQLTDAADQQFEARLAFETCLAGFDERGRIVATLASIDFDLTLPGGGTVAMAGTTAVTVHATHRRQGILRRMIDLHLNQAVERGQPMAGLWASEETIYGRFGYGHACPRYTVQFPAPAVSLPGGPGDVTLRLVTTAEAADLLPPIYDQVRATTAGLLSRTPAWWHDRHLSDPEYRRDGATALRVVVAERAGADAGYVTYRLRDGEHASVPDGKVEIEELVAVDDDVRRSLWAFIAHIDLYPNVEWWNCPVDEPVLHEIDRVRQVTARLGQSLWLRPLDVVPVLEARRYEHDGTLVLQVDDGQGLAGGGYRLEVSGGEARCAATTERPEISIDIATLGSLVLGGVPALGLARAGRISSTPEAVDRLGRIMSTTRAPHAIEVF